MLKKTLIFIIIISSLLNIAGSTEKHISEINELLVNHHISDQFDGVALIVRGNNLLYEKSFGLANREWDVAHQINSRFRIGSLTKQFTAAAILQLAQAGKIDLHKPLVTYLPNYPPESGTRITIHQLLNHTAGVPNYTSMPEVVSQVIHNTYTPEEFIKFFSSHDLDFTPGTRFNYSNSGYSILGLVIEKVSGLTYEQYIQTHFYTPLGMTNSGYDHFTTVIKNRASGYVKHGDEYKNVGYLDMSVPYSAGALYSSAHDLLLWNQALHDSDKILNKKYRQLMFTPSVKQVKKVSYSYGLRHHEIAINEMTDIKVIGHSGSIPGFNAYLGRVVVDETIVILLSNRIDNNPFEIFKDILQVLYDDDK